MPRIEMTPTVRLALLGLRIYLIVLLGLIALKFIREFSGSAEPGPPPPGTEERATDSPAPSAQPATGQIGHICNPSHFQWMD